MLRHIVAEGGDNEALAFPEKGVLRIELADVLKRSAGISAVAYAVHKELA